MSMEFLAWPWAEGFFGEDARKFRYSHLSGALTFIPYGTMVDHFQHIVFEKPDMTPRERHDTWKELLGIYMPWMKLDGDIPFYSEGEGWQRQHHIYSMPFYYIDYCLGPDRCTPDLGAAAERPQECLGTLHGLHSSGRQPRLHRAAEERRPGKPL